MNIDARFGAQGLGWSYGDNPTFVRTARTPPRTRISVEFYAGDLAQLVNERRSLDLVYLRGSNSMTNEREFHL